MVHAGGVIRMLAYVSGKPAPEITWRKDDDKPIPEEAAIETTVISSALVIKNCQRKHQGVYNLIAKNAGGERRKTIIVEVLGKYCSLILHNAIFCFSKDMKKYFKFNFNYRCSWASW